MEHNYQAKYDNTRLRPLSFDDLEFLRNWRNDKQLTKFLSSMNTITKEQQELWYKDYLTNPNEIIFAIDETNSLNRLVGSVAIYDMENSIAKIGKILIGDSEAHGKGMGKKSLVMAMAVGFQKLKIESFCATVCQENVVAHHNDIQIGFRIVGSKKLLSGETEDSIKMTYNDLIKANAYVSDIKMDDGE